VGCISTALGAKLRPSLGRPVSIVSSGSPVPVDLAVAAGVNCAYDLQEGGLRTFSLRSFWFASAEGDQTRQG